jgi:hypothetical protein
LAVGRAKSGRQDAALYGRLEACRHRRITPEMSASARYFKLLQINLDLHKNGETGILPVRVEVCF